MGTIVGESATIDITENYSLTASGNANERIVGDKHVESKNSSAQTKEKFTVEAGDKISIKGDTDVVVEATKSMTFKCGDAEITLKSDGKIVIKGSDVTVRGSGNVTVRGQNVAGN
jgi:type VI secretion system secreted protein VgrG